MSEHLTDTQIGRYVERKGDADEILGIAQHLDHCWECRDRTAALVDDGSRDRPHREGAHNTRLPRREEETRHGILPWAILVGTAAAALAIALLSQK